MCRSVWTITAGRTDVTGARLNRPPVGVEGRRETRAQLGQCSTVYAGQCQFFIRYWGVWLLKDTVRGSRGNCRCDGSGVKGLNSGSVVIWL